MVDILKTLEAKLKIDEHGLEEALREHPDLFYKVASEVALAISNRDEAKQDVDEAEASIDIEIRGETARLKEKTTETEIKSLVKLDKKVVAANDKFLAERLNAAKWSALKEAYESRSYALSKLVDLYLANYYSSNQDNKTGGATVRDVRSAQVKEQLAERRKRVEI